MVRIYHSDAQDTGNRLTQYIEYHHPCPICGDDVQTYDYYEEQQYCSQCEDRLLYLGQFLEWFSSEFEHDPIFWFSHTDLFNTCFRLCLCPLPFPNEQ